MKITGFEHLQLLLLQRFPDIGKIEQSLDSVETAQYKDYKTKPAHLQWFSKESMTGNSEVLKALAAIASITSCKEI